jgi:hypothetical protein
MATDGWGNAEAVTGASRTVTALRKSRVACMKREK